MSPRRTAASRVAAQFSHFGVWMRFPSYNYHRSVFVALLHPLRMVILASLATGVPMQAQCDKHSGSQEHNVKPELPNFSTLRIYDHESTLQVSAESARESVDNTTLAMRPVNTFASDSCRMFPKLRVELSAHRLSSSSERLTYLDETPDGNSKNQPAVEPARISKADDPNRDIYYKNKLEFSLEGGWLPVNIPWPFDVFNGDAYTTTGVNYTLVPILASVRWHLDDIGGRWIFRGNWDLTFTASITAIPRGPETRYFAYIMGFRRNFVRPRRRTVPYFNLLGGMGQIDAKGPLGVYGAQGQNFTFTLNLGSGLRYNFNPRYAISTGINYMHISNFYLSEPKFLNYGINVYGPMVGVDIQLHPHRSHSESGWHPPN
jgi:hypothetical protein